MNKRRFLSQALLAGTTLDIGAAPADASHLRYGGDAAFAPFESLDAQGQPRGFQVELLAALGREIGVTFSIELQPWAQTEAAFRQGRVDVVAMVDTAQRRDWARFTRGHASPVLAVYHRPGRAEPQGLQDLVGLRVAVLDGEAMRDTLATWLAQVPGPFVRRATAAQALAAVRQGQADVALLPRAYADPLLRADTGADLRASPLNLTLQTYALAVLPGQDALHARLQQGLDALERDGRLEALRLRWLASHQALAEQAVLQRGLDHQRAWTWGLAGVSGTALLLMGAGLWRRGRRLVGERRRRQDTEGALQHAQSLLDRSFARHPDPMLVVDRASGTICDANDAFATLLGLPAGGLIGQPLAALSAQVDTATLQHLVTIFDSAGALDAVPLRLQRAGDDTRDCLVSAVPLGIDTPQAVFCLLRDITERLAQDAELRSGYDALTAQLAQSVLDARAAQDGRTRAEGLLHEFTRSVAHDLKTPLSAVQGFAGLLRERLLAGHLHEAQRYTEHIARAGQRMAAMIDALAGLAQVTRRPLQRQPVDMQQLARETWSVLAAAHPERHVACRFDLLPATQADAGLAAQVWQNLLENAAKYSAQGLRPTVSVDSYRDARGTWYRITDNGVGFDRARAQRLFQPFQRMHQGGQFEGSGVGLSLVRRIVDHHGGEVRLHSQPGQGTVAEFTLDPLR